MRHGALGVRCQRRVTARTRNSSSAAIRAADKPDPRQSQRQRESGDTARPPTSIHTTDQQEPQGTLKLLALLPTEDPMPICTVLEKRDGVVVGAELSCSVREENKAQRESYSADWHSVSLKTQPRDRQTVTVCDDLRRETMSLQWQACPLIQTCPSGVFRVGTLDRGVREHQLLPKRRTLPLPIFAPAELGVRFGRGAPHTQEDLKPFPTPDGVCPSKRSVDEITRDLPPVKPTRMEFANVPKALGRSMSQEAQRG